MKAPGDMKARTNMLKPNTLVIDEDEELEKSYNKMRDDKLILRTDRSDVVGKLFEYAALLTDFDKRLTALESSSNVR